MPEDISLKSALKKAKEMKSQQTVALSDTVKSLDATTDERLLNDTLGTTNPMDGGTFQSTKTTTSFSGTQQRGKRKRIKLFELYKDCGTVLNLSVALHRWVTPAPPSLISPSPSFSSLSAGSITSTRPNHRSYRLLCPQGQVLRCHQPNPLSPPPGDPLAPQPEPQKINMSSPLSRENFGSLPTPGWSSSSSAPPLPHTTRLL
jgi:hypothetical protein